MSINVSGSHIKTTIHSRIFKSLIRCYEHLYYYKYGFQGILYNFVIKDMNYNEILSQHPELQILFMIKYIYDRTVT